jgi:hypothetical protein
MKKLHLLSISLISLFGLQAQDCSNLFISEYVEGWSNNKAIELFNPTNDSIDLSNYSLSRWSNGSTTPFPTVLEGSIAPHSAFVIGLDKRNPDGEGYEAPLWDGWYVFTDSITGMLDSIYTDENNLMDRVDLFICPNYEDGTMYFNGNDAVTLETVSGDILDIIGKIGEDPGEAWGDETGAYWTKDQTLIRKANVTEGFVYDPTSEYTFDPTLEWDSLPANSFTNLGSHECDCTDEDFTIEEESVTTLLYPNPNTTGILNVESNTPIHTIQIYNVLGQNVFFKELTSLSKNESITLEPKLEGIYFVKVQLENKQNIIKKLLIK